MNRSDTRGGAATVAWNLFEEYDRLGHSSWFMVQYKFSKNSRVLETENDRYYGALTKSIRALQRTLFTKYGGKRGVWRFNRALDWFANPMASIRHELGIEEFSYEGPQELVKRIKPDIVHVHVLHGGYFDLRYLAKLSSEIPVFVTLHDAWMLAGHCAHSFDCDRWKTGCGHCPDLSIPKAIKRDGSALNWRRKRAIYKSCRLHVATPCEWLMGKVKQSILADACVSTRVIPYGVNQEVFKPGSKERARKSLGLEQDAMIFLFSANGIKKNRWKDFELMKRALELVSKEPGDKRIVFLALGESASPISIGRAEIRFQPYTSDPKMIADFYRAADIYLHASKVDTFPNAVLEALSCGTPVIATAVGGIPEQIKGWSGAGFATEKLNLYGADQATGVLVQPGDATAFATAMSRLISAPDIRSSLGDNAFKDAIKRFPNQVQTNSYLEWYREVVTTKT